MKQKDRPRIGAVVRSYFRARWYGIVVKHDFHPRYPHIVGCLITHDRKGNPMRRVVYKTLSCGWLKELPHKEDDMAARVRQRYQKEMNKDNTTPPKKTSEEKILRHMADYSDTSGWADGWTVSQLRSFCGIPASTLRRALRKLHKRGLVFKVLGEPIPHWRSIKSVPEDTRSNHNSNYKNEGQTL